MSSTCTSNELNMRVVAREADAAAATPAASVLVLRNAGGKLQVLMQQRPKSMVFGGFWVFPGGTLCDTDLQRKPQLANFAKNGVKQLVQTEAFELNEALQTDMSLLEYCALRELSEETQIDAAQLLTSKLSPEASKLHYFNRWLTPYSQRKRFDTRFFISFVKPSVQHVDQRSEVEQSAWLDVDEAYQRAKSGSLAVIMPALMNLKWLAPYATAQQHELETYISAKNSRQILICPQEQAGSSWPMLSPAIIEHFEKPL